MNRRQFFPLSIVPLLHSQGDPSDKEDLAQDPLVVEAGTPLGKDPRWKPWVATYLEGLRPTTLVIVDKGPSLIVYVNYLARDRQGHLQFDAKTRTVKHQVKTFFLDRHAWPSFVNEY